jgi:hypothetical protein
VSTMASQSQWLSKLKGIDAYPKTIEEFKVRTMQGGLCTNTDANTDTNQCRADPLTLSIVVSLLAFLAISILLISEVSFYFATVRTRLLGRGRVGERPLTVVLAWQDTVDKMLVDGQRNAVVPIFFDIDFPKYASR